MYYFNTAAIGRTPLEARKVSHEFECASYRHGPRSQQILQLFEHGVLPKGLEERLARTLSREWSGVRKLGCDLARMTGLPLEDSVIVFTSGTSAALQLILGSKSLGERILVTTNLEHQSEMAVVNSSWRGAVRIVDLERLLNKGATASEVCTMIADSSSDRCVLLASHVVSTSGVVLPIKKLCQEIRARYEDVIILLDGAHGPGHVNVALGDVDCDAYICSGHKWLRGPLTSGFILMTPRGQKALDEILQSRLIAGYAWNFHDSARDPGCYGLGTMNFSALVGLQAVLNMSSGVKEVGILGRRRCLEFEDLVKELAEWRVLQPQGSAFSRGSVTLLEPIKCGAVRSQELVQWLERECSVICDVGGTSRLRFSFSGEETDEGLRAAVAGLTTCMR